VTSKLRAGSMMISQNDNRRVGPGGLLTKPRQVAADCSHTEAPTAMDRRGLELR